ncbi:Rad17 cell cycle checkpoint protein-domain-containing protein [Lipomyces kononenkoae]|uniref:Rad17 cell cycle checkpoint protein-domain-containing protein n=1 Tax=Lipomyces kononenkoae TaxID=34357 RepID=A0ACC3SSY0_LIPKO
MPPSRKRRRRSPSPLLNDTPRSTRSRVANERASNLTRLANDMDIQFPDDEDDDDDSQTIIVIASDEMDVPDMPAKKSNPSISHGLENPNSASARKTASASGLASPTSTKSRQTTLTFPKMTSRSMTASVRPALKSKSAKSVKKPVKSSSSSGSIGRLKRDTANTYATSIDDELSDSDPIEDESATESTGTLSRTASRLSSAVNGEPGAAHLDSQRGLTFRPSVRPQSAVQGTIAFPSSPQGESAVVEMLSHRTSPIPVHGHVKELWIEKYAPRDSASLALHKRKYEDVRLWFCDVFAGRSKQRALVLVGPAGTSKTAALIALSCEMNFDIIEWANPPTPMVVEPGEGSDTFSGMFSDFLSKAQQFGSATSTTTHSEHPYEEVFDLRSSALNTRRNRVILLEDFPSILSTSHAARKYFLDSIHSYVCSDISTSPPIVFVISELEGREDLNIGSDSSYSAQHILGRDLLADPRVARIQFNPVNKTLMSRVLRDIATKEGLVSSKKSSAGGLTKSTGTNRIIAELAQLGDVRSSINALQWWATTGGTSMALGRETYLAHFQAVGKVLYNKREDVGQIPVEDAVLQAIPISSLVPTLFENYPGSCADTDELVACSDALSDSDILLSSQVFSRTYGRQDTLVIRGEGMLLDSGTAGSHVAIRGLMCGLRRPLTRQTVSIKDFITGKRHDRKPTSSFTSSSNGNTGYSMCNSLGYQVFKRQQDVLTDVARYYKSTKLGISGDTDGGSMSMSETAVMYMQCTAFWEALIKKNDKLRRIGGQYNGFTLDIDDDDDDDVERLGKKSSHQFSQTGDAFLTGSIADLMISDDDIEETLSN